MVLINKSFPVTSSAGNSDSLLTPPEAAAFLRLKVTTLAIWRASGRYGLPFVRCGRYIRYRRSDLEKFLVRFRESGTTMVNDGSST